MTHMCVMDLACLSVQRSKVGGSLYVSHDWAARKREEKQL
jgi:hypothetical protein